jgi:hypothetical protein
MCLNIDVMRRFTRLLITTAAITSTFSTGLRGEEPEPSAIVLEEVALEKDCPLPAIPVTIKGETYLFAIDTGCSTTVVDSKLVPLLYGPSESARLQDATGLKTVAQLRAPELTVGDRIHWPEREVLAIDLSKLRQVSGCDLRGIIGMDCLAQQIIRLNPDTRTLAFLRCRASRGICVPLYSLDRLPYVDCAIAGWGSERFLVDTANIGSCGLRREAFQALSTDGAISRIGENRFVSATGGKGSEK